MYNNTLQDITLITNSTHYKNTYVENKYSSNFLLSFIQTFSLIFLSELGDKTFILILVLQYKSTKKTVFFASLLSMCSISILSMVIGYLLDYFLYQNFIDALAILIFGGYGISLLMQFFELDIKSYESEVNGIIKTEIKEKNRFLKKRKSMYEDQIQRLKSNSRLNLYESTNNLIFEDSGFDSSDYASEGENVNSLRQNSNRNLNLNINTASYNTYDEKYHRFLKRKSTGQIIMNENEMFEQRYRDRLNSGNYAEEYIGIEDKGKEDYFTHTNISPFSAQINTNNNADNVPNTKNKAIINVIDELQNSMKSSSNEELNLNDGENDKLVNNNLINNNNNNNNELNMDYTLHRESNNQISRTNYFWKFAKSILITEFGDKTQFALVSLSSIYNFLGVFSGCLLGLLLIISLGCISKQSFTKALNEKTMSIINCIIFFVVAAEIIYSNNLINIFDNPV